MSIRFTVDTSGVNPGAIRAQVMGDKTGKFAAVEWHRLYQKYTPEDTGTMYNTVSIEPWMITHTTPYARYQYYGKVMGPNIPIDGGETFFSPTPTKALTGASLRYTKINACSHWDQAAIPTQRPKLIRALQAFIDGGLWR